MEGYIKRERNGGIYKEREREKEMEGYIKKKRDG